MGKPENLVIVESPSKAKTIGKYLGDDYVVKASMGQYFITSIWVTVLSLFFLLNAHGFFCGDLRGGFCSGFPLVVDKHDDKHG